MRSIRSTSWPSTWRWTQTPDVRSVLRSCRMSPTPREQSGERSLAIRKFGYASMADQKRHFISELAADLAAAIKRHWLANDTSADWETVSSQGAASGHAATVPKPEPSPGEAAGSPPPVAPPDEATPLALRARFKEHMSLEFTSEVVRQIRRLLESRDERGRPRLVAREARLIADAAASRSSRHLSSAENRKRPRTIGSTNRRRFDR